MLALMGMCSLGGAVYMHSMRSSRDVTARQRTLIATMKTAVVRWEEQAEMSDLFIEE